MSAVRVHRWLLAAVTLLYLPLYFVTVVVLAVASLGGGGSAIGEVYWAGVFGAGGGAIVGALALLWRRTRGLAAMWLVWVLAAGLAPMAAAQLSQLSPMWLWSAPVIVVLAALIAHSALGRAE